MRSTVVVVTWRGRELVGACLEALAAQTVAHRVLVMDNASDDGTAELLRGHETVRLRRNKGYAGALAAALKLIETPYFAWLNDDAVPEPGWLSALESTLDGNPRLAAAGSVLMNGTQVQSAGVRLTPLGYGVDVTDPDSGVFGFCGGAALLRTDAVRAAGGIPGGFFCYYEDTDTSWRLRLAGHEIVTVPQARVDHRHGASSSIGSPRFHLWNERNRLLMLLRCAPPGVALRELARFTAITAALPMRDVPKAPNFRVRVRLRVLGAIVVRLPSVLVARARIGRRATVGRSRVWHAAS